MGVAIGHFKSKSVRGFCLSFLDFFGLTAYMDHMILLKWLKINLGQFLQKNSVLAILWGTFFRIS